MNTNRREFMQLGCRAIIGAGLTAGVLPRIAYTQYFDATPYRALVCINLDGGNDGFNMLVPTGAAEYSEYASGRGRLSIGLNDLLPLATTSTHTTSLGLHPQMAPVADLYQRGRIAFQANAGTLQQPTSANDIRNNTALLPEQLFSHHDQSRQWHKLDHQQASNGGWGARAANLFSLNQGHANLTAISLDGSNRWQHGSNDPAYNIDPEGIAGYRGMNEPDSEWQLPRRQAFVQLLQQQYNNVFERAYAELQMRAMNLSTDVGTALNTLGELQTPVPADNHLATQLAMVAKLIAVKDEFQMNRQLFYVNMSGFDTHDDQVKQQPYLFAQLANALAFFDQALAEVGQLENVTSFTVSDFGRTLTSNGDGTDHGWGNHHLVMGGAVNGADVYGTVPRIAIDGPDDADNGRIIPTTSASQYAATLLQWMGINDTELDNLLPTLARFQQRDIGFMS